MYLRRCSFIVFIWRSTFDLANSRQLSNRLCPWRRSWISCLQREVPSPLKQIKNTKSRQKRPPVHLGTQWTATGAFVYFQAKGYTLLVCPPGSASKTKLTYQPTSSLLKYGITVVDNADASFGWSSTAFCTPDHPGEIKWCWGSSIHRGVSQLRRTETSLSPMRSGTNMLLDIIPLDEIEGYQDWLIDNSTLYLLAGKPMCESICMLWN